MSDGQYPIADAVRVLSNDTTVYNSFDTIVAGGYVEVQIDLATCGEDIFDSPDVASPPDIIGGMKQAVGPFLNVLGYSAFAGLELTIDEGIDILNTTPPWIRGLALAITPGVGFRVPGWRAIGHYARVHITNTNDAGLAAVYWMAKLSTI